MFGQPAPEPAAQQKAAAQQQAQAAQRLAALNRQLQQRLAEEARQQDLFQQLVSPTPVRPRVPKAPPAQVPMPVAPPPVVPRQPSPLESGLEKFAGAGLSALASLFEGGRQPQQPSPAAAQRPMQPVRQAAPAIYEIPPIRGLSQNDIVLARTRAQALAQRGLDRSTLNTYLSQAYEGSKEAAAILRELQQLGEFVGTTAELQDLIAQLGQYGLVAGYYPRW